MRYKKKELLEAIDRRIDELTKAQVVDKTRLEEFYKGLEDYKQKQIVATQEYLKILRKWNTKKEPKIPALRYESAPRYPIAPSYQSQINRLKVFKAHVELCSDPTIEIKANNAFYFNDLFQ